MGKTILDYEKSDTSRGKLVGNKFTKAIRAVEFNGFAEGDQFVIPTEFKVFKQTFGQGDDAPYAEYIYVDVYAKGKTVGKDQPVTKQFFPSSFAKSVQPYNKTAPGKPLEEAPVDRVIAGGKAAEAFREFVDVQEGMEAVAGKPLVVSKIHAVLTKRYNREELYNAQILDIDFAQ